MSFDYFYVVTIMNFAEDSSFTHSTKLTVHLLNTGRELPSLANPVQDARDPQNLEGGVLWQRAACSLSLVAQSEE